jgi:hypothetical protein
MVRPLFQGFIKPVTRHGSLYSFLCFLNPNKNIKLNITPLKFDIPSNNT